MRSKALQFLRAVLQNPVANFRDGQWESIEGLLARKRMLVVQRTGWGKSMVYFLATRLWRDKGAGPTLLISPLVSLMRNQVDAATRLGLQAETINSSNTDEWDAIEEKVNEGSVDLLLVSPERLANDQFREGILSTIASNIGLFVVDEAHCISDWGHDFRPDYKRIVRVLQALPSNVPVLATTATANNRVVRDIMDQLGADIELVRGPLVRESLKLQNINMPSPAARMAWLAQTIPNLPGSGIIYTLTIRDAERVAEWLRINGIHAKAYHSKGEDREELEDQLLKNELKALVATVALGMGFDKPDIGFVIHFQRPSSVVHYYQQVGRAGRAVDEAYGILLCGEEDDHIADFFIRSAFPPQTHIQDLLGVLDDAEGGLSVPEMTGLVNLRENQIKDTLKFLTVESPAPVIKNGSKWHLTASASNYRINQALVDSITKIREDEQAQMRNYMGSTGCLMAFLEEALDDPNPKACGQCRNCNPQGLLPEGFHNDLANRAALFLRRSYQPILPRKKWPAYKPMQEYDFAGNIGLNLQASEGRALCLWRDAGWGQLVAQGKYETGRFSDELVAASQVMIHEWVFDEAPLWVTCIPSWNHPQLVPDFAKRLADVLGLPFVPCIEKVKANSQQKYMENSFQQAQNLDGVFQVNPEAGILDPCLLIDDMVDSRWTFTVAAALLRSAGCQAVYPLALALNSPRMD